MYPPTLKSAPIRADDPDAMPTDIARPDAPLSVDEHRAFADAEAVIGRGLGTFLEVGRALMAIREGRLYRSTHPTFETYCRDRWDMSRSLGYRFIDAAETVAVLPTSAPLPTAESQVRPLSVLPLGERPRTWAEAVKDAGGKVPTARAVREVVNRRAGKAPKPKRTRGWPKFPGFALYREDGRPVLAYKLDKEALSRAITVLIQRGYFDEPRTQKEVLTELARHFDTKGVWDEVLRASLRDALSASTGRPSRYSRKSMRKAA